MYTKTIDLKSSSEINLFISLVRHAHLIVTNILSVFSLLLHGAKTDTV